MPRTPVPQCVAMLLALSATDASATHPTIYLSGKALHEKCLDRKSFANQAFCYGFIAAVSDVLSDDAIDGIRACVPESVTLKDATEVVNKWLEVNVEAHGFAASSLAAAALAERFPCATARRPL